jgi:hypothetical protein
MYIDPGAGSLVLQVMAAGVFAVGVGVRRVRESARRVLWGWFGRKEQ